MVFGRRKSRPFATVGGVEIEGQRRWRGRAHWSFATFKEDPWGDYTVSLFKFG